VAVAAGCSLLVVAPGATAAPPPPPDVSFTGGSGTVTAGGTVYARNGGALTLNVTTTASGVTCVDVTGAYTTFQTSQNPKTSWAIPLSAGTGDGSRTVTAALFSNANGNKCTGNGQGSSTATFVLDNTGPVVSPKLTPAPNAAGWNNANTTVSWTATDAGSGVEPSTIPADVTYNSNGVVALSAHVSDKLGNVGIGSGALRLDKAAPSITGSRTPAANAFGWNNSPVTVHFSCSDNPATDASGLAAPGCPADTAVGTDGTNQSVTGNVSDVAGNGGSATVSGINMDRVSPTVSGVATTSPNGNGWYNGNVVIHWTSADDRSGIDPATLPGDSTITSEGSGLTASASVSDKAGNTGGGVSAIVNIDKTPPVTGINGTSNSWTTSSVKVTLSPVDALSGLGSTFYTVDGGATQTGTSFTLTAEGVHVVTFWSADKAGNVEATRTAQVKIDKTAPSIGHAFTPFGYGDGDWTNAAAVRVTFTCSDAGSGVASCTPPVDVTTEGGGQQIAGTATDNAGNTAGDTATVSVDRSPPTVFGLTDRAANGSGWYADDVTISFTCADQAALSGIRSCPASQTLAEGKNQAAAGTATDIAGNTATASVTGINVDKTAPRLTGAVTTAPNGNGWYDNSVIVGWTCSDEQSGIDGGCPAHGAISGEGSNLGASASVSDKAGNLTTTTVSGIRIDTTAPVTTATASAPAVTGWYADRAQLTLNAADNLSGIDATYYRVDGGAATSYTGPFDFTTGGVHTITFWSKDQAGNLEDASGPGHTLTVKIDNITPSISGAASPAPNASGWNNSDVTVRFTCSDAESGIAGCTSDAVLRADAANQSVTGTATDHGGNSSTTTVGGLNIDQTAPSLSGSPTTSPNVNGWYNGDVTVHWTASDATSGVDGDTLPADSTVAGEGADLTAGPVAVSDVAGNTASASVQHLRIDRTAPTIAGAATASANGAGWYSGDVTVHWTCSDGLSGVAAGACPADATVGGEGEKLSAAATVSDRAGNPASGTVSGIKIDRTAPSTDISAPSGWHNTDASVTLSATDNLSRVAATYYTINGGTVQTGTDVTFSAEGTYDLQAWSVDHAGNVESIKSARVLIDKTAPTIRHTQLPAANAAGWNNTDVTITFACNDTGGSGVASCTAPLTETHEGKDQPEPGTATDNAGNRATDPATVSIDRSAPTINGTPDRSANGNDWYNADVTVTFTCADQVGLSGVTSCGAPVTLGEGADQSASGTVADAAGNHADTTVRGVNVDETDPSLSGTAATAPNTAGWYRGDVTVNWTCADALSGIDGSCPADSTVTGEGDDLSIAAQTTDKAGNATGASVGGVRIDRTAASTTASLPTPDSTNGWYAAGPTVSLTATDSLSGVAATYYQVDGGAPHSYIGAFTQGREGVHTITFWSVDKAGNVEDPAGANNRVTIRVDTTRPTITGARLPVANSAGWNNGPVTASFDCADSDSGVGSCPDPVTVSTQGSNQSVTGTATDNVGNTNTTAVGGINIDLTKPTLTGAATTAPNADGWYRGDVTVHWNCADDLSGVAGDCPAASTITSEGDQLTASASVSDQADNTTTATLDQIKIDRHGPQTSVSAPSDWQPNGVSLDVTAADNLSGVKATYFTVNGGAVQTGNKISLAEDGVYDLTFWSTDLAGNEGAHGAATVRIDKTGPSITHTVMPDPNSAGWNNSDATVRFLCTDQTSGVKSCTADQVVTTEAADQKVVGSAADNAGNSSSDTATVSLDKTKPTVSGTLERPANGNGWYNDNVAVNFTCGDSLSGVSQCARDQLLSEGADQSATGTSYDTAGNSQTATMPGINIDKTPPSLSGVATTAPNSNGWYPGDVTVHWSCADALSGIDGSCPADSIVAGEGDNRSATATVSDRAGNQTTRTVSGLQIDRSAPVTAASAPDPTFPSGWYGGPVTVTLSAIDSLSGVNTTYYSIDGGAAKIYGSAFPVGKGVHTVMFWSADNAGNLEAKAASGHSLTFKVDDIAPTISGAATTTPNTNGWYNGPVTVRFSCSDAQSGVAPAGGCPADKTLTSAGANQYVTGTAADVAGNTATARVGPISIDLTAPTFAPYSGPSSFTIGQPVTSPSCQASDALSGLARCELTAKTGSGFSNANGVGDFTYAFTATDKAGNTATQSITQHVGYRWTGFLQPITNTAHDLGTASVFNAGSTVPVKFQLKDAAGGMAQATYMPVWIQPADLGTSSAASTAINTTSPATVGGSFKWDGQQYMFTWQTPKSAAGHYYRIGVQLDSGDVDTTLIQLK
jgi:hypothetical protein